ncbi:hypothetical protein ACFL1U_02280 [Patescibacteria group bacterium]
MVLAQRKNFVEMMFRFAAFSNAIAQSIKDREDSNQNYSLSIDSPEWDAVCRELNSLFVAIFYADSDSVYALVDLTRMEYIKRLRKVLDDLKISENLATLDIDTAINALTASPLPDGTGVICA